MTLTEQILLLWRQGFDTHEIAQRTGAAEAAVHREIIDERTRRLARPWAVGGKA